jgi:hypothetical protein
MAAQTVEVPPLMIQFIPNSPSPSRSRLSFARLLAFFSLFLLVWAIGGSAWAGPSWIADPKEGDSQNQSETSPVLVCDSQGQNCGTFNKGRVMGCGVAYTLKSPDGRAYNWQLTGGGTLSAASGASVTLTAPASNAGCSANGTLQMIDPATGLVVSSLRTTFICGAYGPGGMYSNWAAFGVCEYFYDELPSTTGVSCHFGFDLKRYNCQGELIDSTGREGGAYHSGPPEDCLRERAPHYYCIPPNYTPCCGGVIDYRTDSMKQGGCCPDIPSP